MPIPLQQTSNWLNEQKLRVFRYFAQFRHTQSYIVHASCIANITDIKGTGDISNRTKVTFRSHWIRPSFVLTKFCYDGTLF